MIICYQTLEFNAWGGGGWNAQRSAENVKRGGAQKVLSIESEIKVKMVFFLQNYVVFLPKIC